MRSPRTLTPAEALGALTIDFEGIPGRPPSLLGILDMGEYHAIVLDEALRGAAKASGLKVRPLPSAVASVLLQSRDTRRILAFSEHELRKISEHAALRRARFEELHVNARLLLRRWVNKRYPGLDARGWTLKDYMRRFGQRDPRKELKVSVPLALRTVAKRLSEYRSFEAMPRRDQELWHALLRYNRLDCVGLHGLVMRAAHEVAAEEAASSTASGTF